MLYLRVRMSNLYLSSIIDGSLLSLVMIRLLKQSLFVESLKKEEDSVR